MFLRLGNMDDEPDFSDSDSDGDEKFEGILNGKMQSEAEPKIAQQV